MTSTRSSNALDWPAVVESAVVPATPEKVQALTGMVNFLFPNLEMGGSQSAFSLGAMRGPRVRGVQNRDYFHRYFAFGIPIGDLSDTVVLDGLRKLAHDGRLDDTDPLIAMLLDENSRGFVARKSVTLLHEVGTFTADTAMSAAIEIAKLGRFDEPQRLVASGMRVLTGRLAWIAIAKSDDDRGVRNVVDRVEREWGLQELIRALVTSGGIDGSTETPRVHTALQSIRHKALAACIADFDGDDSPQGSVQFYHHYLGEGELDELATHVKTLLDSGEQVHDIAARFVGIGTSIGSGVAEITNLYLGEFERLVPRAVWTARIEPDLAESPTGGRVREPLDVHDVSLGNRRKWANNELRRIAQSSAD